LAAAIALASSSLAQVRISQVGMGAGNNCNVPDGNFIELYNAGSGAVSLSGRSLQWASSASGAGWTKFNLTGTIAPHCYWLVRVTTATAEASRYPNIYGVPFTADETYTLSDGSTTPLVVFGKSAGKVVLANTTAVFTTTGCSAPDAANVLDLVSWSNAPSSAGCFEGSTGMAVTGPTAAPSAFIYGAPGVLRACGGLSDTDDNAADFQNAARPPRNSAYPANAESVPAVNAATQVQTPAGEYFAWFEINRQAVRAYQGQTIRFAAQVVPCSGTITSVSVDLGAVGGSSTQPLYDDGTHGDQVSGDGVYTVDYVLPAPSAAPLSTSVNPQYLLNYRAVDSAGRIGFGQSPLVVDPLPPANDLCGSAQVIPAGPVPFSATVTGTNVSATSGSVTPVSGNGASAVYPFGQVATPCTTNGAYGGTSRDLWYSFTPQESATYTISTCLPATTFSTVLMVLDSCPPDDATSISSALACSQQGCTLSFLTGASAAIISNFSMQAGTTYLIRLAEFGSGSSILGGTFGLSIVSGNFGACCSPTGGCAAGAPSSCTGASVYQGDNTACSFPLQCTGACCLPSGACMITGPGNCPGDFSVLGIGVPCNPNYCPQPASSTCCRGATCAVIAPGDCTTSGALAGAVVVQASSCNSGSTATPCCYADYSKAGGITVGDIFDFLNDWFAGRIFAVVGGDGATGSLTVADIFNFLNAWFAGGC
jgi:hypothetical protein